VNYPIENIDSCVKSFEGSKSDFLSSNPRAVKRKMNNWPFAVSFLKEGLSSKNPGN